MVGKMPPTAAGTGGCESGQKLPSSPTAEMVSNRCVGVKERFVLHRSPNAYNPPDESE